MKNLNMVVILIYLEETEGKCISLNMAVLEGIGSALCWGFIEGLPAHQ